VKQLSRVDELRVLLAKRPDRTRSEKHGGADALQRSLENSLPAWIRRPWWSANRNSGERITGPFPPLVSLEVGHATSRCTSHATPGMEIALPAVQYTNYTELK